MVTSVEDGYVVPGVLVGTCIRNTMVNMFVCNVAVITILIKVPRRQIWESQYEIVGFHLKLPPFYLSNDRSNWYQH